MLISRLTATTLQCCAGMAFAETAAGQQLAEAISYSLPYVEAGSPVSTLKLCMQPQAPKQTLHSSFPGVARTACHALHSTQMSAQKSADVLTTYA